MMTPLPYSLGPLGRGRGRGAYLRDAFTGPDSTLLSAHPMDVGGGWTLVQSSGASTNWHLLSGVARNDVASFDTFAHADAGVSDATAQVTITLDNLSGVEGRGLAVRLSDYNNAWIAVLVTSSSPSWRLLQKQAGGYTLRASANPTLSAGVPYIVQVVCSGSTITATLNGSNSISYGSATFNQTATRFGLSNGSDNGAAAWDDFSVIP